MTVCIESKTQLSTARETLLSVSPTPQIVEVTRIIKVEQTVVVTATPTPLLAQECFDTAVTQLDLNGCANLERDLAITELDKTIAQIKFTPEEKPIFDQLRENWQVQVKADCEFLYGQVLTDESGILYYKWGSMAPMQRAFCEAEKYKQHTEELKFAYLNP